MTPADWLMVAIAGAALLALLVAVMLSKEERR
jgi:hypothetical protein